MMHPPLPVARRVPVLNSLGWLRSGWQQLCAQPWHWTGLSALIFVAILALGILPIIGTVAIQLLLQIMVGGMLTACARGAQQGRFRFRDYFEGFRRHTGNLAVIGLLYVLAVVAFHMVFFTGVGGGLLSRLFIGEAAAEGAMMAGAVIALLFFVTIWLILLLTLWFAPALVMFNRRSPLEAMQRSFRACVSNLGGLLLLALMLCLALVIVFVAAALLIFALNPPGFIMGLLFAIVLLALWIMLLPILSGAAYMSYTDIFGQTPALPPSEDTP